MGRKKAEESIISVPQGFVPYDYQKKVLEELEQRGSKRAILVWHRRAGKDIISLVYLFMQAVKKPGLYGYFFPTYTQAKKAIWEGMDHRTGRRYLDYMPKQLISKINDQELKIELTNGSIIRFFGTDDFDALRGFNPVGCVFSEFAYQKWESWSMLVGPVIARNKGWVIFNSTPDGPNHYYGLYLAAEKDTRWVTSYLTIKDTVDHEGNPLVTNEEIEEFRAAGMDEDAIQQEYFCCWRTGARGNIFSDSIQKLREEGKIGNYPHDDYKMTETYWDLGRDDDTVIWFVQRDGLSFNIVDYYENRNKDMTHYVDILKSKGYRYKAHYFPHDGKNKSLHPLTTADLCATLCAQSGVGSSIVVLPRPVHKQDAINATRSRFSRMRFNENTTSQGLKKLSLYRRKWDSKNGVFSLEPMRDGTQHAADAFMAIGIADDLGHGHFNPFEPLPEIITDFDIWGHS